MQRKDKGGFEYMGFQLIKIFSLIIVLFTVSACIDLEPDSAVNMLGEPHTLTATFIDDEGPEDEPIIGALIIFRVVEGPNEGLTSTPFSGECVPDSCRTNDLGQVSWTYTSEMVGIDSIIAFSSLSEDGFEIEIPSDTAIKIWQGVPRPIPALSEWGLIAMAGILGIIGFIVIRRRKVSA